MYFNKNRFFKPESKEPFKVSRSKIDLFLECERCFYLDRRFGVTRPRGPAFTLNIAVDALMKKEFDIHRKAASDHPLLKKYGIKAIPFEHESMEDWRNNFVGVQYLHKPTNLIIFGAVDDIWVDEDGNLMVVDYKATSKEGRLEKLSDSKWELQYRRQMEIYQWLLKQNGFKVSPKGYFVYVNAKKDKEAFDGQLEFETTLIEHVGKSDWVDKTIKDLHKCLLREDLPKNSKDCEYCAYRTSAGTTIRKIMGIDKESKSTKIRSVTKKTEENNAKLF